MISLRASMIEANSLGAPGSYADLPELEILEPKWLYDHHMGGSVRGDILQVDSATDSGR